MTATSGNQTRVMGRAVGKGTPPPSELTFKDSAPWMPRGLCFEHPSLEPDVWFETDSQDEALKECRKCPVQMECLKYKVDNEITHGTWGGAIPGRNEKYYRRRLRLLEKRREEGGI